MHRTIKTLPGVILAVISLIIMSVPAAAATAGTVTFVANITVPCGMGYPVVVSATNCSAHLNDITCADLIFGKKNTLGTCSITGSGLFIGNCTLARGTFWGSITLSNGSSATYHFNFEIEGGPLVGTGTVTHTGQTGPFTIEADITPVASFPGGPSCLNGTQTEFLATGEATFVTT